MAKPDQDVRNRKLNPEARMELKEHLREFRDRFIKAAIATAIAAVLSVIFLYQPFIDAISEPLKQINAADNRFATLNYGSISSPFDQLIRVGTYIGLGLAAPVWLYQGLRFLLPALHTKEKNTSLVSSAAQSLPLPAVSSSLGTVYPALFVHSQCSPRPAARTSLTLQPIFPSSLSLFSSSR